MIMCKEKIAIEMNINESKFIKLCYFLVGIYFVKEASSIF